MDRSMGAAIEKLKQWWLTADRTQRTVSVVGGAFVLALVVGTLVFATKPKMTIIAGGNPAEAVAVVEELQKTGIKHEVDRAGNVKVKDADVPRARMQLAKAGLSSGTTSSGASILENINSFTTSAQEKELIRRAAEAELGASIATLDGVRSALVHISMGKDSAFADEKVPPSAVVNITPTPGANLSISEGKAIARLVQNSVSGLEAKRVTVINNQGQIVYDGEQLDSAQAMNSVKLESEIQEGKRRQRELQERLDIAFGVGNTIASVNVELDMDSVLIREYTSTPSDTPDAVEELTETLAGTGGTIGGVAGTESNFGAPAALGGTNTDNTYSSSAQTRTYPTNVREMHTDRAAGSVIGMNVQVVVDNANVDDVPAVNDIVRGYLAGYGETETGELAPGFASTVTATDFNRQANEEALKAEASAANAAKIQQALAILPLVVLVVVAFMVARSIAKAAKNIPTSPTLAFAANGPQAGLPGPTGEGTQQRTASENPFGDLENMDLDEETLRELALAEDDENMHPKVRAIRSRIDVPLEQIKKMAEQRPDTIAMLLKGWMMEDRN